MRFTFLSILFLIQGSLFVIAAGLTAEWEHEASRIADPALSACAAIVLVVFNYPFSKYTLQVKHRPNTLSTELTFKKAGGFQFDCFLLCALTQNIFLGEPISLILSSSATLKASSFFFSPRQLGGKSSASRGGIC